MEERANKEEEKFLNYQPTVNVELMWRS